MATLSKIQAKTTTPKSKTSPGKKATKTSDRINCRISPAIKQKAEAAAAVLGQSITAFTETALAEKAQSVLAEEERIVLSERDFTRFVKIVNDASSPAPALVKAMRQYEAAKAAHPDRGL